MQKSNTQLQNEESNNLHLGQQFEIITINNMTTLKIQKGSSFLSVQNREKLLSNTILSQIFLPITTSVYTQSFQKICPHIIQSNVISFGVKGLNKSKIQMQIGHSLISCQIQNIEGIQLLGLQKMKCLYLSQNNIVNVKSLIKCFGNNSILQLNLDRNRIVLANDRQWIRRLNFDKKSIVNFRFIQDSEEFSNQDFTYLIPFQLRRNNNLKNIILITFNRIKQKKLFKMIPQIFPHTLFQKGNSRVKAKTLLLRYSLYSQRPRNLQEMQQ